MIFVYFLNVNYIEKWKWDERWKRNEERKEKKRKENKTNENKIQFLEIGSGYHGFYGIGNAQRSCWLFSLEKWSFLWAEIKKNLKQKQTNRIVYTFQNFNDLKAKSGYCIMCRTCSSIIHFSQFLSIEWKVWPIVSFQVHFFCSFPHVCDEIHTLTTT